MRIGILTSGGDAPGMNATIRAVVRAGLASKDQVFGIYDGYRGLVEGKIQEFNRQGVSEMLNKGGTILGTARLPEFEYESVRRLAIKQLQKHDIDALICLGGDGTYTGALRLHEMGIKTIGVPCTIDNDIASSDFTIGFSTALNTACDAIDRLRDTSSSHQRCSIIEVMGRHAGYIALWCGIANGAEDILLPERPEEGYEERIIRHIIEKRKIGKKHHIIINAEGVGDSNSMAKRIEAATGMETRATIIGHIQRGGCPTCKDRVYASAMGAKAADLLCDGASNRLVAYRHGEFVDFDIEEALAMHKDLDPFMIDMSKRLAR